MKILKHFLLFCLCLLPTGCAFAEKINTNSMFVSLDNGLIHKGDYEKKKLAKIDRLKEKAESLSYDERFAVYNSIFKEYSSYQYDSAYVYSNHLLKIANRLKNSDYKVEAQCNIVFCLLSAGLFKEAFDMFSSISLKGVSKHSKVLYFTTASRLNYDNSDYIHAEPYQHVYIERGNQYTDSLLTYLRPQSSEYLYSIGIRQMKNRQFATCLQTFNELLKRKDIETHTKAIITSCMGWIYLYKKDNEKAQYYLVQAAIYDNISVTRETTALCTLARLLYRQGDIQRATEYVRQSLANATFYGARQRVIEISSILPIIEQDRYNIVQKQRNTVAIAAAIAVLLLLLLSYSWWLIRKQMHILKDAQAMIAGRNQQLKEKNDQLKEISNIKDEYIGRSFYANAEHINKVERLYRSIERKIALRRFDDIKSSFKESELIVERKLMFVDFDETFLKLFPNFIEEYNKLFNESEQKEPELPKRLTTEMRIFALIRLGITDSDRIASFLNYSVHTINTYKTRVKNRSKIDNDRFEQRIMEI